MNLPEPIPGNDKADRVHNAEQMWATASEQLDQIIAYADSVMPDVFVRAGGNDDISVIYDWWKAYVMQAEMMGGRGAHDMTVIVCCAALTRLMRIEDRMRADTVLAQLDKEITDNDDDR